MSTGMPPEFMAGFRSNPMGQGLQGPYDDPNFTVPRLNAAGQWEMRRPGANAGFLNYGQRSDSSPLDFIDSIIRREDFPPGLEGQKQYEAALNQLSSAMGVPNSAGRSGQEYAVFEASQAAIRSDTGGSAGLGVQQWAVNNPDLALQALIALANDTISDPTLLTQMDDSVIRDIVLGLGGVDAVNALMTQERQRLEQQGLIPPGGLPEGAQFGGPAQGDKVFGNQQPNQPPPAAPGESILGEPNYRPGPGDPGYVDPNAESILGDPNYRPGPGDPGYEQTGPPDRSGAGMVGTTQAPPYQMQENGEVIGVGPLDGMYQYTPVGNDVYLDVSDPNGNIRRFTGDVVEAAYSQLGYNSFDEMVNEIGYASAYQLLSTYGPQQPAPPATPSTGGGGGGGGGTTTPSPNPVATAPPPVTPGGIPGQDIPLPELPPGWEYNPPPGFIWDPVNGVWTYNPSLLPPPAPAPPNVPY